MTYLWISLLCGESQNRRADPDNISAGQKYIFDGMILADVIPNDGWKQINSISHKFEVDKENPRVEVLVKKNSKE